MTLAQPSGVLRAYVSRRIKGIRRRRALSRLALVLLVAAIIYLMTAQPSPGCQSPAHCALLPWSQCAGSAS